MRKTYSQIVLDYLRDKNDWVVSWKLIKVDTPFGWLGSSGDRTARRLYEKGKLERKRDGKYSYYRIKPSNFLEELNKLKNDKPIASDNQNKLFDN